MLQKIFDSLAFEPERLNLWWVSASEGPRYSKVTEEFYERIKELGPTPMREEIFLCLLAILYGFLYSRGALESIGE